MHNELTLRQFGISIFGRLNFHKPPLPIRPLSVYKIPYRRAWPLGRVRAKVSCIKSFVDGPYAFEHLADFPSEFFFRLLYFHPID